MVIVRVDSLGTTVLLIVKVALALGTGLPSPSKPSGVVLAAMLTLLDKVFE